MSYYPDPVKQERNRRWAEEYVSGQTIQSIADSERLSFATVREALVRVGVQFRSRGAVAHVTPEQLRERLRLKSKRQYHAKTPERRAAIGWRSHLKFSYDMTPEQYTAALVGQSGRCDVCGEPMKRPVVDHNHETGVFRALIHQRCNIGVGYIEDKELCQQAISYLKRHE